MAYTVSKDVIRQRSEAPRTHGARSQVVARRRAGYVKQSVLQPLGIRYADLDQIAKRYLDLYARVITRVEQYDAWAAEHGFLQADGSTPPWIKEYYGAVNSASRLLSKLETHLDSHRAAGPSPLDLHLAEHYVDAEVEEVEGDG